MKHCILVKFKKEFFLDENIENIKSIFNSINIEGVNYVEFIKNCIDRENRYDLLIRITMEKEALSLYDTCLPHHRWKEEYSSFIDKKAIFDYED